jgi:hypothetical protein
MMKKHRQHHVWQHYLQAWAVKGKIFCLRDGKIFRADTKNVAVEHHFYKLHRLTAEDVALLKFFVIDPGHEYGKRVHENFLNMLLAPRMFVERNRHLLKNTAMDAFLETQEINVLEDYHASIERSFLPLLRKLTEGDVSFYSNDDDCMTFLHYIATQHMRTKGIKVRIVEGIQQIAGKDISRIWDIASLMFAVNIGGSLYVERKRRQFKLLHNNTEVAFITGDQPVINLHGKRPVPPTEVSLYYPISAKAAVILGEVDEEIPYSTETLTAAQVSELNESIFAACHNQIFGHSKEVLLSITLPKAAPSAAK